MRSSLTRYPTSTVEEIAAPVAGAIKIGPFGSQLRKAEMVSEGVKVYGQENLILGDWSVGDRRIASSKFVGLRSCELKPGDLVITMMGTIGKCAIFPETAEAGIMDSHLLRIQPDASLVDPIYLAAVISAEQVVGLQIERLSHGSIMAGLSSAIVRRLEIPIPSIQEQRRIAEILGSLEEAILQSEQAIIKLQKMKQGLLHDLLTRGIGESGELRDLEGHPEQFKKSEVGPIPRGWRIGNLDDLAENLDGLRLPLRQSDRDKRHGDYPYYGASGIIDWIDDYSYEGDFVLLGEDGENIVSRQIPLAFRVTGRFWANNHVHVFRPRDNVDSRFLVELLEATDYSQVASGSAQPKLTQDGLRRLNFVIPCPDEQRQLGDLLETHQNRVQIERAELDKLRILKLGLMDDLLTGRVRVSAKD